MKAHVENRSSRGNEALNSTRTELRTALSAFLRWRAPGGPPDCVLLTGADGAVCGFVRFGQQALRALVGSAPIIIGLSLLLLLIGQVASISTEATQAEVSPLRVLTNAASVRELTPEEADRKYPVRLSGVVTFYFDTRSCFVQDESAGIYVGNGSEFPAVKVGDVVTIEGVSGAGDYAPIVKPSVFRATAHTNLPAARQVTFEDLMTGSECSQWVEVEGLVRAVHADACTQPTFEMVSGGGRLTLFTPPALQANLADWVDSRVRVRGVCGTWFNKLRQLFGVRLMVPRPEDL